MDADTLRRQALAARQFKVQIDAAEFTLTAPTHLESQVLYERAAADEHGFGSVARLKFLRAMLVSAVAGWSGVLLRDALPAHEGDEALAFDAGVVEVLLDAQPEWEARLSSELMAAVVSRRTARDTAAKN